MTGGLVFMDMTLIGCAVDNRHGLLVGVFSQALVATLDGFDHILDVGAHMGALAGIVLTVFFRLTSTFASL